MARKIEIIPKGKSKKLEPEYRTINTPIQNEKINKPTATLITIFELNLPEETTLSGAFSRFLSAPLFASKKSFARFVEIWRKVIKIKHVKVIIHVF